MTQKIVIRTFIVLFGLIAVSVVGALIFVGDGNPTEELHAAATEFGAQPNLWGRFPHGNNFVEVSPDT